MFAPISQLEYVTYTRCLEDIKVVEQCSRKNQLSKIGFFEKRFVKLSSEIAEDALNYKTIFERLSPNELKELENKIVFINSIHRKLGQGELKTRNSDDCTPLAAECYNTHFKTITAWNAVFNEKLHIAHPSGSMYKLDPAFTEKSASQIADEKALLGYFELLHAYPKLKRSDEFNDFKKGAYQIIYDQTEIAAIREEIYQRLYTKALSQGLAPAKANELAANFSRPGIVCEDQFWLWIRDVVVSPQGYKHTYNRMVWKCDLDRVGGAAALPILLEKDKENKFIVQVAFRHASNSFEIEMARGGSKPGETSLHTARREIKEETGYETGTLIQLGTLTPDTGLVASVVPIFLGKVTVRGEAAQDKTEAIKGRYAFTLNELMEGFKRGYIDIEIDGIMTQVPIRDPFLAYALLMAQYNQLL